jgi:hypothetical protein
VCCFTFVGVDHHGEGTEQYGDGVPEDAEGDGFWGIGFSL